MAKRKGNDPSKLLLQWFAGAMDKTPAEIEAMLEKRFAEIANDPNFKPPTHFCGTPEIQRRCAEGQNPADVVKDVTGFSLEDLEKSRVEMKLNKRRTKIKR